ncbi:MAG: Rieske (2Fe-2S) protein [Acidimicrobiales bacterium]
MSPTEPLPTPEALPSPGEEDADTNAVTASVGALADHAVGSMRLARVGERRIAVIRTADGVHALDNACPHQGYGLVTGALDGDVVTCQWHNWKFRVTDGRCLLGEEDVACHRVDIVDGDVQVTVAEPSAAERRAVLWPSLLRGVDRHYTGQIARDAARLLDAGATPAEIVAAAMAHAAPRLEDGIGHELANAADCLHLAPLWTGLDAALPVTQAVAGIAEGARDRPVQPLPAPDAAVDLLDAIEREDAATAMAAVLGRLDAEGTDAMPGLRADLIEAASAHHLGYGHGAIYTQKTFELLDLVGDDHAGALLPWLAMSLVQLTREDLLPYMRRATRAIEATDLDALAAAPDRRRTGWSPDDALLSALLDGDDAPIETAALTVTGGAGVEGLLDAVVLGAAARLLRHDPTVDFDPGVAFDWLDITHALTYANAARWAWRAAPGPATARLALFTVFLLHDSGRAERWGLVHPVPTPDPRPGSVLDEVLDTVLDRRPDDAVAHVLAVDPDDHEAVAAVGEQLARVAMADRAGSFIVAAHVVKLIEAARREATETASMLPLAAAARFAAAPRLERFVAAAAVEAVDFVRTGTPPRR